MSGSNSGSHVLWRWGILAVVVLVAAASTVLSLVLYLYVLGLYRSEQLLRMDPTGAAHFVPENTALPTPNAGQARLVLFGDSRLAMWSPLPSVDGCDVVNRAWSGETTAQALLRLDRDVIALRPRTVVIQYGINDLKGIGLFPEQEDAIIEQCLRNLKSMVARLRDRKVEVVLLTIFPVGPVRLIRRPIWSDRVLGAVARINRELAALAGPGVVVIDCDPALAAGGRMRGPLAADEFHLTLRGYQVLNEFLEPRLAALLPTAGPE